MIQFRWKTIALSAMICAMAGAAAAQTALNPEQRPRAKTDHAAPVAAAAVVADAPNARLAGLINSTGAIVRNKGIASVTRISTGVYCIQPTAATGLKPGTLVASVSPEYYYSLLTEIKVQWASVKSGCKVNQIGVYTFADGNADGIYSFSNAVGFSIVVP